MNIGQTLHWYITGFLLVFKNCLWTCSLAGFLLDFTGFLILEENNSEIMLNPPAQYLRKFNFHAFTQVLPNTFMYA